MVVECEHCGSVETEPAHVGAEDLYICLECGEYFESGEFLEDFYSKRRPKKTEEDSD